MNWLRNKVRNWLANDAAQPGLAAPTRSLGDQLRAPDGWTRTIELIEATNGTVVSVRASKYNPNGPDKNHTVNLVLKDGEDLMAAVKQAMVEVQLHVR